MAEEDSLRKAASDAMKAGEDVTRRVRDLTLAALRNRSFDREGIREVVRAVTEGMAAAAPASGGSLRQAMGQAFRGMDEALTKSVEAGESAVRQMVATGRGVADNEVKQALAGLKKIEEDFVDTVSKVASIRQRARSPRAARAGRARDPRRHRNRQADRQADGRVHVLRHGARRAVQRALRADGERRAGGHGRRAGKVRSRKKT